MALTLNFMTFSLGFEMYDHLVIRHLGVEICHFGFFAHSINDIYIYDKIARTDL
jgi:hypothetical protein